MYRQCTPSEEPVPLFPVFLSATLMGSVRVEQMRPSFRRISAFGDSLLCTLTVRVSLRGYVRLFLLGTDEKIAPMYESHRTPGQQGWSKGVVGDTR